MIARGSAFVRRWYFAFALALFVFSPELRRIADWATSVHKLSPFSVLPILGLLVGGIATVTEWKNLGSTFRIICTIWLCAFGVALIIGAVSASPLAAILDLLEFCAPIAFATILAATHEDVPTIYRRVAGTMLFLDAVSSVYAIYQYVSPPAWDILWVINSGLVSNGTPEPFGLRVFGTLNSYAAFAHFTALTMVLNLPRLRRSNWMSVVAFVPCTIALILTSDRTAWIAFVLGFLAYLLVAPTRSAAAKSLALALSICVGVSALLIVSLKGSDDVTALLQARFESLSDIGNDTSFNDRQQQTQHALRLGLSEPLGQGLGDIGSAAIAGSTGETNTLDNGYLARLVELGVLGFIAYLTVLASALITGWLTFRRSATWSEPSTRSLLAAALATQIMLVWIDFSTDGHPGLLGVVFWFSLYIASAQAAFAKQRNVGEQRSRFARTAAA